MRISFSGERSYEVNVAAQHGAQIWNAIAQAGEEFDITPYGTETMHVLRAEKGFIIVGQETDGSVSPVDLGMGRMVSPLKDFLGKRSLTRSDTARTDRKQLVGLKMADPQFVAPEGSQIVGTEQIEVPAEMLGHVTSSYMSPTLGYSIAMALLRNGHQREGDTVWIALADGSTREAIVCSPVFFDPNGERQNA